MPDVPTNSYSLSEVTKIVGVDEKTLHLYAHKGLLDPNAVTDAQARFSQVDCARLRIIKRANDIGYEPENIFNLIGSPDEVLKGENPLAACQEFAVEKYKQILNELDNCEPLEQLNKKCDLKLLKNYIKNLEGEPAEKPQNYQSFKKKPISKVRDIDKRLKTQRIDKRPKTQNINKRPKTPSIDQLPETPQFIRPPKTQKIEETPRTAAAAAKQTSGHPPQVQSYSVEKLWEYIQKVEGLEEEDSQATEIIEHAKSPEFLITPRRISKPSRSPIPPDHIPMSEQDPIREPVPTPEQDPIPNQSPPPQPKNDMRTAILGEPPVAKELKHEFYEDDPHLVQQSLTTNRWSNKNESNIFVRTLTHPLLIGSLILALAAVGYFKFFKTPDIQISLNEEGLTETPLKDSDRIDADEIPKSERQPGQETSAPTQDQTAKDIPTFPDTKKPDVLKDKSSVPKADNVEKTDKDSTAKEDEKSDLEGPVLVKNLNLSHDSLKNIYQADFTIAKNPEVKTPDPIKGFAFIHLETNGGASEVDEGVLLPDGQLQFGMPSKIRKGANFSIKNLINVRVKGVSTLSPSKITSAKALVYSAEGILLLEQPFDSVSIKPFFTAAENSTEDEDKTPEKTQDSEAEDRQEDPPDETPATETPAEEQEVAADDQKPSEPGASDEAVATANTEPLAVPEPPPVETPAAPAPQPTAVEEPAAIEETPTGGATKPQKTDHPDAAIWEQKSYDAAVGGNFDKAVADATKAIDLDPGRVNPYINRSWAYIEKNMLENAIQDCEVALQIDPENTFAYNNRGLAYQRKNELKKAREDYNKACEYGLKLGCQNFDNLANQSRIAELISKSQNAFRAKNWDEVIRVTSEVIGVDPKNAVAYTNRSAAYAQKNYLVKALKDSNDAIKLNPNFSLAYNNRGYVFELLGNSKKAAADYLKSCSLGLDLGCKNFDKLK